MQKKSSHLEYETYSMNILLFPKKDISANVQPFCTPVTNIFVDFGTSTKLLGIRAKLNCNSLVKWYNKEVSRVKKEDNVSIIIHERGESVIVTTVFIYFSMP